MPVASSAGKVVVVTELSFTGIVTVRNKIRDVSRANTCVAKQLVRAVNKKSQRWLQEEMILQRLHGLSP